MDIQNKQFRKNKIGGYNTNEVNDYLEEIINAYQEVLNDYYVLKDKVNVLNESVQYYRTMESTIQNVLVLADKTAQDTKAAAYDKAEQIKKEANERAEKITSLAEERVTRIIDEGRQEAYELAQKVEEAKRQYLAYKVQFKQLLQAQVDFLDQGEDRMVGIQDDLTRAFSKIQEEAITEPIPDEQVPDTMMESENLYSQEEDFYTKAYVPLTNEEVGGLLN